MNVALPYHPHLRRCGRRFEVRVEGYLHPDGTAEAIAYRLPWDQGGAEVELTEEETAQFMAELREELSQDGARDPYGEAIDAGYERLCAQRERDAEDHVD
jgi:hypothetical protein